MILRNLKRRDRFPCFPSHGSAWRLRKVLRLLFLVAWNQRQAPFRIYGNTYYVGPPRGEFDPHYIGSGHVLIDGGVAESVRQIAANVRSLGFRMEDVKLSLNSHGHHDHAGGIAERQRRSGARVVASKWSAAVLKTGGVGRADPQYPYGVRIGIAPVKRR